MPSAFGGIPFLGDIIVRRLLSLSCGLLLALASLWTYPAVAASVAMPLAIAGAMPDPAPALAPQPAPAESAALFVLTPQPDDVALTLTAAFDPGESFGPSNPNAPLIAATVDPGDPEKPGTDPPETA